MTARIVTRADDAGMTQSANNAILDSVNHGICKNVSLMAPAPFIEEAADMFRDVPGISLGLHFTATCEWDTPRWGPVSDYTTVPSITLPDGTFPETGQCLHNQGAKREDMVNEARAQLNRLRELGLAIEYMDMHMGVGWVDDSKEGFSKLCQEEGIMMMPDVARMPAPTSEASDPFSGAAQAMATLAQGDYLWVQHPCYNDEEMRGIKRTGKHDLDVGADRDNQRRFFMEPCIVEAIHHYNITPIRYVEL